MDGGAINTSGGITAIRQSAFVDNNASSGGAIISNSGSQHLMLKNSTLSGNKAATSAGAINSGGNISIDSSTIAYNAPDGLWLHSASNIKNSIIAFNTGNNCSGSGTITSYGYNIDSGSSCGFSSTGDLQDTDPMLYELGDYFSPTPIHMLTRGSLALDAGSCTAIDGSIIGHDQRGFVRPASGCDIGAYEREATIQANHTYPITLKTGWNLVSFPLYEDMNATDINATFFQSNNYIEELLAYNPYYAIIGNGYVGFKPDMSDATYPQISEIQRGEAFWLKSSSDVTFTLGSGDKEYHENQTYHYNKTRPLSYEWMLQGIHSDASAGDTSEWLDAGSPSRKVKLLFLWDNTHQTWYIHSRDPAITCSGCNQIDSRPHTSNKIKATDGFWVKSVPK